MMGIDLDAARRQLGATMFRYVVGRPRDMQDADGDPNEAALARYRLVPRVMTGAAGINIGVDFLGRQLSAPLAVGAYAADLLLHDDGILPIARVCADLQLPLMVSEECLTPFRAIAELHRDCWLQLRAAGPVTRVIELVEQSAEEGGRGILMTVLAPVHPRPGLHPGGVDIGAEIEARGLSTIGARGNGIAALPPFPAWSWEDLARVVAAAQIRGLPLIVKGVLGRNDAARAFAAGCRGVLVSNLGVRQLARWAAAADRLPDVRAACGAHACLLLDGGIRSGGDVVVARLLGADLAVLVRPVVLALAAGGEPAVRSLLTALIDEVAAITSWMGAASLADLQADQIVVDGPASLADASSPNEIA